LSFEERLAAVGRALDGAVESMRRGASRSNLSEGATSLKEAVSSRVSGAIERSKSAVAESGSRMMEGENRGRLRVAGLLVACVLLTAIVTRSLVGGGGGSAQDAAMAEKMRAAAETRDARNAPGTGVPAPVRAVGTSGGRR
jgi:hypothetical protein